VRNKDIRKVRPLHPPSRERGYRVTFFYFFFLLTCL
jgi:hypothetical protein